MKRSTALASEPSQNRTLGSNLISQLFERPRPDERLIVLDMGHASSSTVNFFNQFKCRLTFLDLQGREFLAAQPEDPSHEELVAYFQQGLNLQPGVMVDVCLFWDLLSYLDGASVKAFIEALDPHVDRYTRGYSLGLHNARNQLPHCRYGLDTNTSLTKVAKSGTQPTVYPHNQRALTKLLDYFEIDKSRLMSDGRIEYIMSENRGLRRATPSIW